MKKKKITSFNLGNLHSQALLGCNERKPVADTLNKKEKKCVWRTLEYFTDPKDG